MRSRASRLMAAFSATPAAFAVLAVAAPSSQAACRATPRLNGSFIQPDLARSWSRSQWRTELEYMQDACMSELFLQWTADSKARTAVYDTGLSGYTWNTSADVVDNALSVAEAEGMDVYVGLQLNEDWFVQHADDTRWLDAEAALAVDLSDELYDWFGAYDSFAGWYLAFEMDNYFFTTRTSWDNMIAFYDEVIDHLHSISPSLPVVISPFFNTAGGQTPAEWTTMWTYILQNTDIDVIALQDGVGAQHATSRDLGTWFDATADAITAARVSTELWADTETFNGDFKPMAIREVVASMDAVSAYVSNYVSFSYNHYGSPGQVSSIYDTTYRDYLDTDVVETSAPSTPSSPSARANGSMTIDLSWTASTDNIGIAGYKIYRDGQHVWTSYGTTASFTDSQLTPSTRYEYTVQAFDAAGNLSSESSRASATTSAGTTYGTNLAARATYTTTLAAHASYADAGGELTDGTYAAALLSDGAWQGRNTGSPYSFTVDLGSSQTISEITSDWFQYRAATVLLPASVRYEVSRDNASWTTVGTVSRPAVGDGTLSKRYRVTDLSSTTGRYVKVTVTPASASWTFVDEIEVRQ